MMATLKKLAIGSAMLLMAYNAGHSQVVTTPRPLSPSAAAIQTIGISKVTINYSRPGVKGRKIWGDVVPYGWNVQLFGNGNAAPWRAGANENTTITLSHDAKVEGIPVPAGTYGLFYVVNADNTGEAVLSKNANSWGSFFYDPAEDLLRVKIDVRDNTFTEQLTYDFINLTKTSAELVLNWEKKQFPLRIEFAVDEIVMKHLKDELHGAAGFVADGFITAALYAFENNIDLDQAMKWIDEALKYDPTNFVAIRVKTRMLFRDGKAEEANKIINDALEVASENDISNYGYGLLGLGLTDKAIKVLTVNTARFPKSANAWDTLGEAYFRKGDKTNAVKSFRKALSLDPPANVKNNSEKFLKELGAM
ncbi:MAG TPA: DUF2911 domain-containing protein [Cyclobacteriaceae bacterium]|nr:DUF2911 domain-containing protein [Cyclobacteriaceae bacterium]